MIVVRGLTPLPIIYIVWVVKKRTPLDGVIFSGRKRAYLQDRKFVKVPESGLRNRCCLSYVSMY